MTSAINPNNIDGQYPVAGQDNNSQGFRDNFTNTKTNFQFARDEITELQNKAIFKTALTGSGNVLNNNMGNAVISNAQLIGQTTAVVTLGNVTAGTANIVFGVGSYQTATTQGNTQLNLTGWPSAGLYAAVTLQLTTTVANANITLPSTVSQGLTGIQGLAGNVITFAQTGTYNFEFTTSDGGTTVTIQDLNRPLSFYTNSVNVSATTASANTTTGALIVSGGVGIGGNLNAGGNVSGSFIIGDGSQLTNLPGGVGSSIINGTSNVRVIANSNVTVNIAGSSNVAVFATTGGFINGIVSASGTITGGNVATAGTVSATGNITGGNIIGNVISTGLISTTGNVQGGNIIGGNVSATNLTGSLTTAAQANITSVGTLGSLSVTNTITGGNVATGGTMSATGNITGNYFFGNGSALTGVAAGTRIFSGTTELKVEVPSGNIQATFGNVANVIIFSPFGANVQGFANITGNVIGGNILTIGQISAAGNLSAGSISTAGNITGNFINASGNISLTGNVIAGNLTTSNSVVSLGNVTGANIFTDGTVTSLTQTAIPAGGSIGQGYLFSSTANFGVFFGSGAPTLVAAQGSLYLRSDGSTTNNRMYINTDGSTGWTAVTTAS